MHAREVYVATRENGGAGRIRCTFVERGGALHGQDLARRVEPVRVPQALAVGTERLVEQPRSQHVHGVHEGNLLDNMGGEQHRDHREVP